MPDQITARSPMADIETRMGITPVEELLAERMDLVRRSADLRARYGPWGTWDALRRAQLSTIRMRLRAEAARDKLRTSEAALDDAAHADPRYLELITEATRERAELARLDAMIEGIDATIRRADAIARYLTAEARL